MSAPGGDGAKLAQLGEDLRRIATNLAQFSMDDAAQPAPGDASAGNPEICAQFVRSLINARRMRSRYFGEDLFADHAWDMMLELLDAELAHRKVSVSTLCTAAAVPTTTGIRWLNLFVDRGIATRRRDPFDARRVYVELCAGASAALRRYVEEVIQMGPGLNGAATRTPVRPSAGGATYSF